MKVLIPNNEYNNCSLQSLINGLKGLSTDPSAISVSPEINPGKKFLSVWFKENAEVTKLLQGPACIDGIPCFMPQVYGKMSSGDQYELKFGKDWSLEQTLEFLNRKEVGITYMQRQYNIKWNVFENVWKVTFEGEIPLDLLKQAKNIKIILKLLKKGKTCKKETNPKVEINNSVEVQEEVMKGTDEDEQILESKTVEEPSTKKKKKKKNRQQRQQLLQQKEKEKEKEKVDLDSEEEKSNQGSSSKPLNQNSSSPMTHSQQNTRQTPTHKRSHSDIEVMVQQDKSSPPIKQVVKKLKGSDDISVVSITGSTVDNLTVIISRNGLNIVAEKGKEIPPEICHKVLMSVADDFSGYCELVRRWIYRQED